VSKNKRIVGIFSAFFPIPDERELEGEQVPEDINSSDGKTAKSAFHQYFYKLKVTTNNIFPHKQICIYNSVSQALNLGN
jgi:hypothetical protein